MSDSIFRVHPAIGIARLGSSEDYYLAPESAAGVKQDQATGLFGGLPVKPGTDDTPITDADFRDATGKVKRQAARFRVYQYPAASAGSYPSGAGTEVTIGTRIGDKTVVAIRWQVHLANKKTNAYIIPEDGIDGYENGKLPPVRNPGFANSDDPANPARRTQLYIDPGPRTVEADGSAKTVAFDAATPATYLTASGAVAEQPAYPKTFPQDAVGSQLYQPYGAIDTLGELHAETKSGRLVVAGGYGRAVGFGNGTQAPTLNQPTDNNNWFDDASDGPVNAVLVLEDGQKKQTTVTVHGGWVVVGDPGYAPQVRNIVTAWDDVYNSFVRTLNLNPALYANGQYNAAYKPSFPDDIQPIFHGAMLQRWATNLPDFAVSRHDMMGTIAPTDDPTQKVPNFKTLIRDPSSQADLATGAPLMPLSLGDATKSFLTVSETQYFLLQQWYAKLSEPDSRNDLGPGERLDKVTLENCLGGRYSPGIEVSYPIRDINLYIQDWQSGAGPFRVNQEPLDYGQATAAPFLGVGYLPLRSAKVQPGDLSKFMSMPWHTDYNSCAVHLPSPNPGTNNTLFWSWPAERPVQVHKAVYDQGSKTWTVGKYVFSIRGPGTETPYPANAGRYQTYPDYLMHWEKVSFVIQGLQIEGHPDATNGAEVFLEVGSLYETDDPPVVLWPTANVPAAP